MRASMGGMASHDAINCTGAREDRQTQGEIPMNSGLVTDWIDISPAMPSGIGGKISTKISLLRDKCLDLSDHYRKLAFG